MMAHITNLFTLMKDTFEPDFPKKSDCGIVGTNLLVKIRCYHDLSVVNSCAQRE